MVVMQPIRLRPRWLTHGGHGLRPLQLIERDLMILRLYATGHTRKEVCALMEMPVDTVRWVLSRCREQSGARSVTQMMVMATRAGLFD